MHSIIFLIIVFSPGVLFSQISVADKNSADDTISAYRGLNLEINVPYENNLGTFQSAFIFRRSFSQFIINSASIWLVTKTFFNQPVYYNFLSEPLSGDMLQPLRLQYEREKKLSTLRYVLGMAQTGAVGYLLYRHIKKYGIK